MVLMGYFKPYLFSMRFFSKTNFSSLSYEAHRLRHPSSLTHDMSRTPFSLRDRCGGGISSMRTFFKSSRDLSFSSAPLARLQGAKNVAPGASRTCFRSASSRQTSIFPMSEDEHRIAQGGVKSEGIFFFIFLFLFIFYTDVGGTHTTRDTAKHIIKCT